MKRSKIFLASVLIAGLASPLVWAQENDENTIDYDSIVRELSTSSSRYKTPAGYAGDPLANVMFHGGVAYTTSYVVIDPEFGAKLNGVLKGVEFNFGIDLLSRYWVAEGSVRSYQPENLDRNTQISLREFDLRVVYNDDLNQAMKYRLGTGLSSRYLTFKSRIPSEVVRDRYTTPSSIIFAGAQLSLSDKVSIGPDIAYRSALVDDTVDKKSFDANIKLNAHF